MSEGETIAACLIPRPSTTARKLQASVRVCIIDVGTNSLHAVIVDVFPNGVSNVINRLKETVHLGERGLIEHRLTEAAMSRALAALQRIRILADGWKANEYLAFATSAVREAENGGEFIEQVWREVGIHIRTISGESEARLIHQGVRTAVDLEETALLVDIGGGSAEFVVCARESALFATSLKIGAARMTEQFITRDPPDKKELKSLRAHFRASLGQVFDAALEHSVRTIIGSSGTMENLAAAYLLAEPGEGTSIYNQPLNPKGIRRAIKRILNSNRSERERIKGVDAKRVAQIVAGAVLVDTLLKDLPVRQVRISPHALREGMIVHFMERNYDRLENLVPYAGVRRRSVYELGYRCRWDREHAEYVAAVCDCLFEATRSIHGMGQFERELLEYAALLHDIGYHISHSGHHKHSLYLIENADLTGFEPREISILANVVRYHRKSLPKAKHLHFDSLPKEDQRVVQQLASLLRLAEGLDRSHFRNILQFESRLSDQVLDIAIHTRSDPELDIWGANQRADFFEKTYRRRLRVRAVISERQPVRSPR